MTKRRGVSPIIIIGMHRSGTTLLTSLLEKLGLYVGYNNDINNEADFFYRENRKILKSTGGSWEHPGTVHYLLEHTHLRNIHVEYLATLIASPQIYRYLGLNRFIRYRSLFNLDFPWGWKDPVNTFTLPIWLELFPDAKIIHLRRHGVDVANSLLVRQRKEVERAVNKHRVRTKKHRFRPKLSSKIDTIRCTTLQRGLDLWHEYLDEAEKAMSKLPQKQGLSLLYEELLQNPMEALSVAADFSGVTADVATYQKLIADISTKRCLAHQNDPQLNTFAETNWEVLRKHGY